MSELEELEFFVEDRSPDSKRMSDYQSVRGAVTNGGSCDRTSVTYREYMTEVDLLVTISGDETAILKVQDAAENPVWVPYIGSRACPLSAPLVPITEGCS